MESLNEDTVKVAIHKALYDIKMGNNVFTESGISEEDFERLQEGQDDELVEKLFGFVAKRLGQVLSPQKKNRGKKDVLEALRSQRDKWLKVIQEYDGTQQPTNQGDTAALKKESDDVVDMDVDAEDTLKKETGTPKPPKAESAVVAGIASSEKAGGKKEPTDMDVETPVKVESQKPTQDADAGVDTKGLVKEEPTLDVKEESTPDDGESKTEMGISGEKERAGVEVEEPPKKKSKTPQKSNKKRKPDDDIDEKKTPRKKAKDNKGTRKIASVKKKKVRKNAGPSAAQLEAARESAKKEFEEEKARILAELPEKYKNIWGQVGYAKWGKDWLPCLFVGPFNVGAGSNMRDSWMTMFEKTKGRRHQMTNLIYWYGQLDLANAFSFIPTKDIMTYDEGVEKGHDKLPNKVQKKLDGDKKLTKAERELVLAHEELQADLLKQPQERVTFDGFTEFHEDDDYVRSLLDVEDSNDELFSSDDDESSLSSASSSSDLESDSDDDDQKVARPKAPNAKKKKVDKKKVAKKPATVEPMEEEELSFAEDEVSSDDSKDEDVKLSDASSSDEQDEDYIAAESGAKKRKQGEPKKKKKKKVSTERTKRAKPPKEKKEPSEYAHNRREHRKFRDNMEEFLPILDKWKAAVKNKDTDAIDEVLQNVLGRVHSMGAPFMEVYNISPLMTATKKVLREKNADRTTQKKLMTKLGEQHTIQKALVPAGFKPKTPKSGKKKDKKDGKPGKSAKKPKREESKAVEPASLDRNESGSSLPGSLPGSQSSAGPATPVRRIQSQGSTGTPRDIKSRTSPKPGMTQGSAKATAQKSEKTSFSLSSLFNKPTSSQSKSDADGNSERQSSQTVTTKSLPSWMTAATLENAGELPSDQVDRLLALEFFQGTASCFPEGKVNREAIARSLESAVYQWSLEQYRKEDTYWPKVHAVVAGICGKRKPGTLIAAIMAGEYESARDVVTLSDELLLHSFEGS